MSVLKRKVLCYAVAIPSSSNETSLIPDALKSCGFGVYRRSLRGSGVPGMTKPAGRAHAM